RMALADKVHVDDDPAITAKGAQYRHEVEVEVRLLDGTTMKRHVLAPRGSAHSFASEADVVEKYEKLAAVAVPRAQVDALRDAVLGLDNLDDAAQLARLM